MSLFVWQIFILLCFIIATLFFGGVHPTTVLWLSGGLALALATALGLKNIRWRLPWPLLTLCLLIFMGLTFTLIPWRASFVAHLAPANWAFLNYLLKEPDGTIPSALTISLTPGESLFSLIRVFIFFIYLILLIALFSHSSKKRLWPLWLFSLLGAFSTVASLILALAIPDFVTSLYPLGTTSDALFPASFINSNFQATFYSLATFAALALFLREEEKKEAKIWAWSLAALALLGLILTASRAAIITSLLGLTILAILEHRLWGKKGLLAILAAAIFSLPAAWYLGAYRLQKELSSLPINELNLQQEKMANFPYIWKIVQDFWPFGAGSEALAALYPQYATGQEVVKNVSAAENILLDFALKFGLPLTITILALGAIFLAQFLRRRRLGPTELALLIGLFVWFIHNMADFNWRSPAIMMAVAIFLATLITAKRRHGQPSWLPLPKWSIALVVILSLGAIFWGYKVRPSIPRQFDQELRFYVTSANSAALAKRLEEARRYAPADSFLYTLTALSLGTSGQRKEAAKALHYVNRALYFRPKNWPAHYAASRALTSLGQNSQALLELRYALEAAKEEEKKVLIKAIWHGGQGKDLLLSLGAESNQELERILLTTLLELDAQAALKEAFGRFDFANKAEKLGALELAYNIGERLNDAEIKKAACARSQKLQPDSYWTKSCRALLLADNGHFHEALAQLKGLLSPLTPVNEALLLIKALASIAQKSRDIELITWLMQSPRATPLLGDLYYKRALIYWQKGDKKAALRDFQFATNIDPHSYAWYYIGREREENGHYELARLAYQKMLEYHPEYRPAQEALKRLAPIRQELKGEEKIHDLK